LTVFGYASAKTRRQVRGQGVERRVRCDGVVHDGLARCRNNKSPCPIETQVAYSMVMA
jgi:hypothetical protein